MTDQDAQQQKDESEENDPGIERVELGDVLRVLAKHASPPNDPDDAALLQRFNVQSSEEREQTQDTRTGQEDKGEQTQEEGPQQGSPQKGSPTAKPGSASGSRKEKP